MDARFRSSPSCITTLVTILLISIWSALAAGQIPEAMLGLMMSGDADASGVLPDAFRSTLSGDAGLWSACPSTERPVFGFEHRHLEPLTKRLTAGEGGAFDRVTTARYIHPFRYRAWDVQMGVSLRSMDVSTWADGIDGATRLGGSGSILGAVLRVAERDHGLEFMAMGPLRQTDSNLPADRLGWGVRFAPDHRLTVQTTHHRTESRTLFGSRVIDDLVECGLNLGRWTWRTGIRIEPWRRFAGELERIDTELYSLTDITDEHRYELSPEGVHRGWRGTLSCDLGRGHEVIYRQSDMETDVEAGAYKSGQKFGWLNYLESDLHSRVLGWSWTPHGPWRLQTEWARSRLDGRGRAKIESWPFTSTVIDLMGIKQIAYGELSLDWDRVSALYTREGRDVTLSMGGAYYRITPKATLATWRPAFLVFGRTDYHFRELDVRRLHLGSLLLRGDVRLWPNGVLNLSLQQFLWVDVEKGGAIPDDDLDQPQNNDDQVWGGWFGGTYLVAGLTWKL